MKSFFSPLSLTAILALMVAIVGAGNEKSESSTRQPGQWTRMDIKSMTEKQIQTFEKKFSFNPRKAKEQMPELGKLTHNKETTPSKAGQELKEKIQQRYGKVKITNPV